jgi:hydroxymethylbilane synthase
VSGREVVIGSRGSALALAQAGLVKRALEEAGSASRVLVIATEGDRRAPDTAWGEGAFVAAIERALLDGTVDVAVHSAKDIPTDEDKRLRIAAYLPRADPRDALVVRKDATARTLADLPAGSRVGTDSPRRTGFLLARRPDLAVHPLHGNVDTRLRRLDEGQTDALVLASAGLDRLGLGDRIVERLDPTALPPAPGQGAIAVQVRADDDWALTAGAAIDDSDTRAAVEAERTFLNASGGGCRAPIGALATACGGELELLAGVVNPDGAEPRVASRRGPRETATDLAHELARKLDTASRIRVAGAADRSVTAATTRPRVLVTRPAGQAEELVAALADAGLEPVEVPAIEIYTEGPGGALDAAAAQLAGYRWVVVTSANGGRAILDAARRAGAEPRAASWAAIGAATASVLAALGIRAEFQPTTARADTLADELPIQHGDPVLVVRGDLADAALASTLRARGAEVDDVIGYRTREAPEASRRLLRDALAAGSFAAVVFSSGSTVRGLIRLGDAESVDIRSIPAICVGPVTAREARSAGFKILAVSAEPTAAAVADAAAAALAREPEVAR